MTIPQPSGIAGESRRLAEADFEEHGPTTGDGEDHFAHAAGRVCKACGQVIEPKQAARRRGESDWAHDVCPPQHARPLPDLSPE